MPLLTAGVENHPCGGFNPMMRFDRFTERAQEAAQRAAEIIQRYGHNQIDTEHILLALIEQPGGVIPQS